MKRLMVAISACGLCLLAIGASPRYLEELRIGGGLGDAVDGGADLDKAGNIRTDGEVECDGVTVNGGEVAAETGEYSQLAGRDLLEAGQDDVTSGNLHVYGGSDSAAGAIYLHAPHAYDTAVDYWKLSGGLFGTLQIAGSGGTYNPGTILQFSAATGTLAAAYDLVVWSGKIEAGRTGIEATQGIITAYNSNSGTGPGCVTFYSCDGTPSYVFASNDGSGLRISPSLPSSNTSGAWLTAGKLKAADSVTDAVDLGTSEVAGLLPSNKIGSGLTDSQVNDALTVWAGCVDSTPIGATSASTGRFSSLTVTGVTAEPTITTWPADTAIQSVESGNVFRVPGAWTSGINITGFTGGVAGQRILIIGGDCDCVILDAGNMRLAGNWTGCANDTVELVCDGAAWIEISRANN